MEAEDKLVVVIMAVSLISDFIHVLTVLLK